MPRVANRYSQCADTILLDLKKSSSNQIFMNKNRTNLVVENGLVCYLNQLHMEALNTGVYNLVEHWHRDLESDGLCRSCNKSLAENDHRLNENVYEFPLLNRCTSIRTDILLASEVVDRLRYEKVRDRDRNKTLAYPEKAHTYALQTNIVFITLYHITTPKSLNFSNCFDLFSRIFPRHSLFFCLSLRKLTFIAQKINT